MARKRLTALPDGLWSKLAELDDYVRQLAVVRGIGWTLAVASLAVATGMFADLLWDLPLIVRTSLLAVAVVATILTALWKVWRPWRQQSDDLQLAAIVERAHPELRESLVSCIELYDPDIPEADRGSPLMRELAARQALHQVAGLSFCDAVSSRPAHRMALAGILAWALLLAPLILPGTYRLLFGRFLAPWQNLDRVSSFWFQVKDGDRTIARGSDFVLEARPVGQVPSYPETVTLSWQDLAGLRQSRQIDRDAKTGNYLATIPQVMQDFSYDLSGAGNRSRTYHVHVAEPPAIVAFQLTAEPPAYTGRPAQVLDGPTGTIEIFAGSRLKVDLTFNKPVTSADWVWTSDSSVEPEPADKLPSEGSPRPGQGNPRKSISLQLAADRKSAAGTFTPVQNGPFVLRVRDAEGLTADASTERELLIVPDRPPELVVSAAQLPQTVRATDTVSVELQATDDIGLGAVELHYRIDDVRQGTLSVPAEMLGRALIPHRFQLELSSLQLQTGDFVTVRLRAADERPVPGPNETWSEPFVMRIDPQASAPGSQQLAQEQSDLRAALQQLIADLQAQRQTSQSLSQAHQDRPQNSPESDPETAKQNEELDRQLELAVDRQQELSARLDQLQQAIGRHPLFGNLESQLGELAAKEFAAAESALQQAEQAAVSERIEPLAQADQQLQAASERLEQLTTDFDKLAQLERDLLELQRLASSADQLAQRLEDLQQGNREPHRPAESDQERTLREQLETARKNQLEADRRQLLAEAERLLDQQPELARARDEQFANRLEQLRLQSQALAEQQDRLATQQLQAEALRQKTDDLNRQLASRPTDLSAEESRKVQEALEALTQTDSAAAAETLQNLARELAELEQERRQQTPAQTQPQSQSQPQQTADAEREQVERLAREQEAAAERAQRAAQTPSGAQDSSAGQAQSALDPATNDQEQETLRKRQEQLAKIAAQGAEAEKTAAEAAIAQAAESLETLRKEPATRPSEPSEDEPVGSPPDAARESPPQTSAPSPQELADNAAAQEAAAQSLQKLAEALKSVAPQPSREQTSDQQLASAAHQPQKAADRQSADAPLAAAQSSEQSTPQSPTTPMGSDETQSADATTPATPEMGTGESATATGEVATGDPSTTETATPEARGNGDPGAPEQTATMPDTGGAPSADAAAAPRNKPSPSSPATNADAGQQPSTPASPQQSAMEESLTSGDPDSSAQPSVAQQLGELAEKAATARRTAIDPAAIAREQQRLQEQLAKLTAEVARTRGEQQKSSAKQLPPLPAKEGGEALSADQLATARNAMQRAAQEFADGKLSQSAAAARQAAEALQNSAPRPSSSTPDRSATDQSAPDQPAPNPSKPNSSAPNLSTPDDANSTPPRSPSPGAIPSPVAGQVAEAVQKLNDALAAADPQSTPPQNGTAPQPPSSSEMTSNSAMKSDSGQKGAPGPKATPAKSSKGASMASQETDQPKGSAAARTSDGPAAICENATTFSDNAMSSPAGLLRQAAQFLRQTSRATLPTEAPAGRDPQSVPSAGEALASNSPEPQSGSEPPSKGTAQGPKAGSPSGSSSGTPGSEAASTDEEQLNARVARLKKRFAGRRWGELPGTLQTEILQAAQKKPNSEYADLIQEYFKEIAKTQAVPATQPSPN